MSATARRIGAEHKPPHRLDRPTLQDRSPSCHNSPPWMLLALGKSAPPYAVVREEVRLTANGL